MSDLEDLLDILGTAKKVALRQALENLRIGKKLSTSELKLIEEYEEAAEKKKHQTDASNEIQTLKNPRRVAQYIIEKGYKVSQDTVYRHIREKSKLRPNQNGQFNITDVELYAKVWLRKRDAVQKEKEEELQRKSLEHDLTYKKIRNEREQLTLSKLRGEMIPRTD